MAKVNINAVLQMIGKSPVAMHSEAPHQRQPLIKRKLSFVALNLNESFSEIAKTAKLNVSFD